MTASVRNLIYLTVACFAWALLGSIVYGIQWSSTQQGRWVEWLIGGQLRWLPWVAYAWLIIEISRKLEASAWEFAAKMLTHLSLAISVILFHALYLRLIRPVLPVLLYGRSYSEVFARFRFVDYLSYQSVFLDLAVYLVVAIPAAILLRRAIHSNRENGDSAVALSPETNQPANPLLDRLLVRLADKAVILPVREIEWVEAADYYVQLHARGEKLLHRESIQNLERQLDPALFVRVHRRALVNSEMITELVSLSKSKWAVRMKSGALVEVSRRRRRQVEDDLLARRN